MSNLEKSMSYLTQLSYTHQYKNFLLTFFLQSLKLLSSFLIYSKRCITLKFSNSFMWFARYNSVQLVVALLSQLILEVASCHQQSFHLQYADSVCVDEVPRYCCTLFHSHCKDIYRSQTKNKYILDANTQ